jgi:mRNA interferase MazF
MNNPKRGEIWLVELNPTLGEEIQKTRPAVVVSSNMFNSVRLRIVVPITSWQPKFVDRAFMVKIAATSENGLNRDSAGNTLQIRSISTERFVRCLGQVASEALEEILSGLIICVDYE